MIQFYEVYDVEYGSLALFCMHLLAENLSEVDSLLLRYPVSFSTPMLAIRFYKGT